MPPFRRTDAQDNPQNPGDEPERAPRDPKQGAADAKQAEEDRAAGAAEGDKKTVIGSQADSQVGGPRAPLVRDGYADPLEPNDPDRVDQRPDVRQRGMDERPAGGGAGPLPDQPNSPPWPTHVSPQTPLSADTFGHAPGPGNPPARVGVGGVAGQPGMPSAAQREATDEERAIAKRRDEQREEELKRGNERIEDERRKAQAKSFEDRERERNKDKANT